MNNQEIVNLILNSSTPQEAAEQVHYHTLCLHSSFQNSFVLYSRFMLFYVCFFLDYLTDIRTSLDCVE